MDGQNFINEIAFSQPVINIGADGGNDIILRGQAVADFHLMLNYASNVWHLVPLDPSYTTLVNGRGVGPEGCPVQTGAVLSIGDYRLNLSLNGTNADIQVSQLASAAPNQPLNAGTFTEESAGSSILLALSDKITPTEIDAGSMAEYELTVTNAGPLVANMQLQLQGIPTAWVQIIPPVLNLNEGRSGTFTVRVSPPRSSAAAAGLYQLHFVAISPNYPRETGVADAMLTILPYSDFLVNGPTPRRLNLSRSHSSDFSDLIVINNSNADTTFTIRSNDDANELNFAYRQDSGNLTQGQIQTTVRSGDNDRIPIQVATRKRPIIGLTSHLHHYYTSVTPIDRPGDVQTLLGEVNVRPMIHIIWLLVVLLILGIAALFVFQPHIHKFDSIAGKRTEMILAGNAVGIKWDVSRFASRITLSNGETERQVSRQGNEFVTPSVSTTYTLRAENFISSLTTKLFGTPAPEKQFRVLLIPRRPSIDVFRTDMTRTNYSKPVRLDWAVSSNADTAIITTNKQEQSLAAENYSGNQTGTYLTDTLISLKASNASGYEEKSAFVNVIPDKINLKKLIAWVRPNGIAVPSDNNIRGTTRWGSLQLSSEPAAVPQTIRSAVNPQPDAQSNSITIPDNYSSAGSAQGGVNPEQQSVNRILGGSNSDGLLIGSYTDGLPTAVPVPTSVPTAAPVTTYRSPVVSSSSTTLSSSVSSVSPESRSSATREFNIKLVEVIEDPLENSGYRVIQYFPDYVLQKSEQILIEWEVEGISTVSIENLSSGNLTASGTEFAYPEKSTNYVLNAEIGDLKKSYSLPVNVAGDTEEDKGSGENCNLKASTTTLVAPGTVMLTWTGGGNDRVQLVSSVKAEEESNKAEKKKEAEAKEKGETYTKSNNIEMSGGIIGDYLQPSGFMRVNVDRQTTFVLNAFDGDGNVICSKEAEIKYTGGSDKVDLNLAIVKIMDTNDVSQPYYTVGQTVQFTIALTDYKAGLEPTGSVMLTDGDSSCTMTLPKDTCAMQMKHEGRRTITAVYGGDDTYNRKTATGSILIRTKIDTETAITSALKSASNLADLVTSLTYDKTLADPYKKVPTGTITFTVGSGTCDLDLSTLRVTCGGNAVKSGDIYTLKEIILTDTSAKMVRARYNGDDYFNVSVSDPTSFATVPTKLTIENAYKHSAVNIDLTTVLSWDTSLDQGRTPAGSIVYKSGTAECTLDLSNLSFRECTGNVALGGDGIYHITGMAMNGTPGDRIYAEYKGDSFFDSSASEAVRFKSVPTDLALTNAKKSTEGLIDLTAELSWIDTVPAATKPHGTIKFIDSSSGSAVCTLDISGNSPKFSDGCTGLVSMTTSADNKWVSFKITNMDTGGKAGDEIKAEYSGDDYFLSAESNAINFNKVETTLVIGEQDARKNGPDHADISAVLGWDPNSAPAGAKPTGTVKFTAGNGSCTLDIVTGKMDCEPETGTVDRSSDDHINLDVLKMLLADNKADRVKATYSGDAVFNPSSSTTVPFWTVPTTLTFDEKSGTAYKPDAGHADVVDLRLNWDPETTKGRRPEGVITLTVGSGSCLLDVATGELSGCSGTGSVPTFGVDADGKTVFYKYVISGMALSDKAAQTIKASYAGDGFFLESSSDTKEFAKIPTQIEITKAYKSETDRADIETVLSWRSPENSSSNSPTGTIKFTIRNGSNGAGDVVTGTCVLDLSTKKLNCDSAAPDVRPPVNISYDFSMTSIISNMLLSDKNADRIKAEYSGDTRFEASESTIVLFANVITNLEITSASKKNEISGDISLSLGWDDNENELNKKPTGTIKIKMLSPSDVVLGTCVLNIEENKLDCDSDLLPDPPDVQETSPATWDIKNFLLGDKSADRVQAEYSGDGYFLSSVSKKILFSINDKIDTYLQLSEGKKSPDNKIGITVDLMLAEEVGEDEVPTGTITFTSGAATCTLNLDKGEFEKCSGSFTPKPVVIGSDHKTVSITVTDMLMSAAPGDGIYAEYSGDNAYNKSASSSYSFTKVDTQLRISNAYKSDVMRANFSTSLTWEPSEAGSGKPTGTITFTIGSDSCKLTLDLTKEEQRDGFSCADESTSVKLNTTTSGQYGLTLSNVLLSAGSTADRVKAEYSGDGNFNPSSSNYVLFDVIPTETIIRSYEIHPDGTLFVSVRLLWDKSVYDDSEPTGTIKLTAGSGTCTLEMAGNQSKFTDCDYRSITFIHGGTAGVTYPEYQIYDLKIGDGKAESIKAEYSGDNLFQKSVSDEMFFKHIDTELKIDKAYKPAEMRVNLESTLSWCYYGCIDDRIHRENPVGPVTFTIGGDSCRLDLTGSGSISCADETTVVDISVLSDDREVDGKWYKDWKLKLTNVLLSYGNDTDRVKAEFAGDNQFNASSSDYVLFKQLETQTGLNNQVKMPEGTISTDLVLSWTETPPDETLTPTGTIKITSGSAFCTLDISAKKFTDCDGSVSGPSEEDKSRTYTVTGLKIGDGTGGSIKAEYSGDIMFRGSSSDELYFTKIDTELDFTDAYKPNDMALANSVSILSWDREKAGTRKPTGTIKYTVGSGSCTLDLSTDEMNCESGTGQKSEKSIADKLSYEILIENMHLDDTSTKTIKAEYSGDEVFNASSSEKFPFRTVDTAIAIVSSYKPDEKHATVKAVLDWDESAADGRTPRGTVRFVVGSGSCTLYLETEQLSCEPGSGTVSADWRTIKVKDMLVDDSSADRVSAEYSGDGFFNPSTSTKVLFDRIDTEISVTQAYRYKDNNDKGYIWVRSLLDWDDEEDEGKTPTGTIKFTIGEETAEYDLTAKTLTVNGIQVENPDDIVEADDAFRNFLFKDLPLNAENVTEPTIEYSGDIYFGPSSAVIEFDKIKTAVEIAAGSLEVTNTYYSLAMTWNLNRLSTILNNIIFRGTFNIKVELSYTYGTQKKIVNCTISDGSRTCDNNSSVTLWEYDKAAGRSRLMVKINDNNTYDKAKAWVYYGGDLLYAASDDDSCGVYSVQSGYYKTQITNLTAVQLNDGSGSKYIQFTIGDQANINYPIYGKVSFTTSNGKTCSIERMNNIQGTIVNNGCGSGASISISGNHLATVWKIKGMTFDPDEAERVYVDYQGDNNYHNGSFADKEFWTTSTETLSITSVQNTTAGNVNFTLSLPYTAKELTDYTWPAGPMVIRKGSYTCTIPLQFGKTNNYDLDLGVVSSDCGGGSAHIYSQSEGYGTSVRLIIQVSDLQVTDHEASTVKAKYDGDWSNEPSNEAEASFTNRVNSEIDVKFTQQGTGTNKYMEMLFKPADTEQTSAVPTGTVTLSFNNSGNTCTMHLDDDSGDTLTCGNFTFSGRDHTTVLGGKLVRLGIYSFPAGDTEVELSYSGDENFIPSSGTFALPPFTVTITPLTDYLYDDGRLYFNTKNNSMQFPKYPEIDSIGICASLPGQCSTLKHSFPLKVSVRVENYVRLASDVWPFSENISFSGIETAAAPTCAADHNEGDDRLFICTLENVSFTTTGVKKVHAHLNNTWLNAAADADFPDMIAVSIPDDAVETKTVITHPTVSELSGASVGDTLTVRADTTVDDSSIGTSSYIYYTYSGYNDGNHRIEVCPETGTIAECDLTLTSDTNWLVAEFLGDNTRAPSTGMRSVSPASVSLSMQIEP